MSNPLIPQTILPGANLHSKHSLNPNGAPIINPDRRSGKTPPSPNEAAIINPDRRSEKTPLKPQRGANH